VGQVDALVALEANEARAQHVGHDLGGLGFADAGFAFDEQRLLELERQENRSSEPAVADISTLAQTRLDLVNRKHSRSHRHKRLPAA